jgi:hypothetical protein
MNDNERRWEIIKLVNDEEWSGSSNDDSAAAGMSDVTELW